MIHPANFQAIMPEFLTEKKTKRKYASYELLSTYMNASSTRCAKDHRLKT